MRNSTLVVFLFFVFVGYTQQDSYQLRIEAGLKGDIVKKTDWTFDLGGRFDDRGIDRILLEPGISYKLTKWLKSSFTYRMIIGPNNIGNYKLDHRLNFNLSAKDNIQRLWLGARVRYQYVIEGGASQAEYDADFDQAIRVKPFLEYDINDCIFSPKISAEFFYDPSYGPFSPGISKIRYAIGSSLELDGPHSFSFKYFLDDWVHDYERGERHAVQISYGYKF